MRMLIIGMALAGIVIALDQWSKLVIFNYLDSLEQPYVNVMPFFNLVKVYNYGVSFGMFDNIDNGRLILSFVALSITVVLCFWLYRVTKLYMGVALGLVIGGAVGNIIDRVRFGAVADFVDFYVGEYHWPAFNVADCAVVIGVFILFIDSFVKKEEKKK